MAHGARFAKNDIAKFPKHIQEAIYSQLTNSNADTQPGIGDELQGKNAVEKMDAPVRIHVHHVRNRAADLDNLFAKHILDGIVDTGLLQDDRPEIVSEFRQTQSHSRENGDND